ncbi:MAG TPA: response regulator [Thermoanaerobaculia bacterium]|nr:response regulator [Thermoanaerobaculia bacterium]
MSTALVIDYTPAISTLLKTILQTVSGFDRVDTAVRGDTAVSLLNRTDYDLVILEPVVPYGDERLLTWLIRNRPSVLSRTILMTTPPLAADFRAEIARSNVALVFEKPFDLAAIGAAFRSCSRQARARFSAAARA